MDSDSEAGYYQQIVHPLLVGQHERKLVHWLKNTDLIKSEQFCSKKRVDDYCNSPMAWTEVKGQDLFVWKCTVCPTKKSIRDDSIFKGLSCSFKDAIRIILAWCKGLHVDDVANMLGVTKSVIVELYIKATSVAEKAMLSNIGEWQIGGPGIVVIIDVYPEGCANTSLARMMRPILCILEIKSFPQKYWLEALDHYNSDHNIELMDTLKERILRSVQTIVRPGSTLIIPSTSTLCPFNDFLHLKSLYPIIVGTRDLTRHNTEEQNLFTNLEAIWRKILGICEEAQFYCSSYIHIFVVSHMWKTVYGGEGFESLLYQTSAMQ